MNYSAIKSIFSESKSAILVLSILSVLALNETLFHYLAKANGERYFAGVKSILSNETSVGNSYLIARSLSDLEGLGFISCVKLDEAFPSKRSFFDTTYQAECGEGSSFWSIRFSGEVVGAGGNTWNLSFIAPPSSFFRLSLWLGRVFGILVTTLLFFWIRNLLKRAEKRRLYEELKAEKFKDLAAQVAHDAASPLSALSMISCHPSLDSEIRELLTLSTRRTTEIVRGLREQVRQTDSQEFVKPKQVDIVKVLNEIVREKSLVTSMLSWRFLTESVICVGDSIELGRVLSNIINNSIEACSSGNAASVIIGLHNGSDTVTISIQDNGKGIAPAHLKSLGQKGFTLGKSGGSGLGIFHAKSYLESVGGKFEIKSDVGVGTSVTLVLKKV